ncbi:MAG TPA: ABC transporter ATP-binding protein [Caldilineaceae bacterium]|nr:ABC transporter ATP-binding protein [Caldilineaceae bacterium]
MAPLLEAEKVTKRFGGGFLNRQSTVALENLSLTIDDAYPSVTVVAGESGSGKTTLARLLLGMTDPSEGQIRYRGKALAQMSGKERHRFRREVQAIFQDPFEVYNPFHKVDRVLTTPVRKFGLASSAAEGRKLIHEALELVGLRPEDTLGRYPHQLSGGQRQRIIVARALVLQPKVIIADEPVSMVDASLRATILESLLRLTKELGISLIYITHDLTTAYQVGDSILVLYQGGVTELGHVELVIKDPKHPYTQLLVDSIPLANPNRRWGESELTVADEDVVHSDKGCHFAPRCPHVMTICKQQAVPFYRTDPRRSAACFLYQDQPVMPAAQAPELLLELMKREA